MSDNFTFFFGTAIILGGVIGVYFIGLITGYILHNKKCMK